MRATRKRSAAITLVLAGSAALSGCGEPEAQRDVYTKLEDCAKDWGRPEQCESVKDGRQSSSYFYGPRYYGGSFPSGRPRPSPNAMEAMRVAGGASQMARRDSGGNWRMTSGGDASSGARSSLSSSSSAAAPGGGGSISRGGFGTSARSTGG